MGTCNKLISMHYRQNAKSIGLLSQAQSYYRHMDKFRRQRLRNKLYTYGEQWSDTVTVDGRQITEEQYIKEQGSIPLKNNLIRRLVRNVVGVYRNQTDPPVCKARDPAEKASANTLNTLMQYNSDLNRLSAMYMRSMEEFLISGLIVHRKWYGRRHGRTDCWTDYVQPNNFFVDNRTRDFRGWDVHCVGEIHDVTFDELCQEFAHEDGTYRELCDIYGAASDYGCVSGYWHDFGASDRCDTDFISPSARGMCRVFEIWRREVRRIYHCHDTTLGKYFTTDDPSLTRGRVKWESREVWRYYFLTPTGHILAEGDTPYAHGSHPYVMKAYPMIDGEIHSFVADVIDQQRYTNRLITLYDWIMRASAKGVLMVPDDCIPRGVSPSEFADAWSRYNGVLFYHPSPQGSVPQQISVNSTNIGIKELLDVQLKFFEDISGVNNALLGKHSNVAMSAQLYDQQTQNATTTLLDLMETFTEFVRDSAYKDMKNIQQYYTPEMITSIAGKDAALKVQDIDFDIAFSQSRL